MRPAQIWDHLEVRPFRLLRIHISGGSSCDIPHPEMAYVPASQAMVALEMSADDLPDKVVFCDPVHITSIEPLDGTKT